MYKKSTRDVMCDMMVIVNSTVWYIGQLLNRLDSKSSNHKEKCFSWFLLYLCEMVDVSQTYYNHFTVCINQCIMLYTLNLQCPVCQLFLSNTEKRGIFVKENLKKNRYAKEGGKKS